MPHPEIVDKLRVNFELDETRSIRGWAGESGALMFFYGDIQRPELKFAPFTCPSSALSRKSADIFEDLRQRDILLHHPYDSYDPVVEFIQQGAVDPRW
jgi:polyphosphate kinase